MTHAHHHHDNHGHHQHHHIDMSTMTERRLWWAIGANFLLTFVQILGGIVSGSLSLVADALHNFSDAATLVIAMVAIRIGRKPADQSKSFGYKRAETIAALINFTSLIIIGLYLVVEAIKRFFYPEPIEGHLVIAIASLALAVDLFTAYLTYNASKSSMNIRAAFIHNMTDALASVGVIIAGIFIITLNWYWVDAFMTLIIAGYVLWHGFHEIPKVIHLLMDGTPENLKVSEIISAIEGVEGVKNAHHIHVRYLDEQRIALEVHIVVACTMAALDALKIEIKKMLYDKFSIAHSTLEFEHTKCE